jgi:hypothetical protein
VALDGEGFCKEIGTIKGAAAELDVELVLADAVDDPVEAHVDLLIFSSWVERSRKRGRWRTRHHTKWQ